MYTTQGIILKRVDAGETDSLCTIYTKDFGKIRARAQGVKNEKAKLKGHLEPLSWSFISFVLGKSGERLIHASLINFWPNIRGDWAKINVVYYLVELVEHTFFAGQKDDAVWKFFIDTLTSLEEGVFTSQELRDFLESRQAELSWILGYGGRRDKDDSAAPNDAV